MRATAVVALLLHALPGAYGVAATTFVRVPEDLAYAEAEARCTQIGAAIASIHSAAENELARTACGNSTCWLGLAETGGDAGTAAASQTWLWQDPPAGTALPAYTNWAAGEPDNAGGVDQRNAIIDTAGEWHDSGDGSLGLGYVAYPLCRVAGELNFTLDHAPQQCQVNTKCRKKKKTGGGKTGEDNVPRKERDPACCGYPAETSDIKHRSCAPDGTTTYQFVQTGEACDVGEWVEAYKKYKCYPCKPGKTCDMGPGDEERCKWSSGTFGAIFVVFIGPIIFCIFAGVGWYVHKRKNADETYAAAARRVLCRRGTKVRAISEEAPALPASTVRVVDAEGIAPNELGTVVSVKHKPGEVWSPTPDEEAPKRGVSF